MLFKPKFFLDLGAESQQQPTPVAPVVVPQAAEAAQTRSEAQAVVAQPAAAAPSPAAVAAERAPSLTTAEAIAAELAAAQASRPAPSLATFAPDCVTPGGALSRGRRRGGADLAGFRQMAQGMMRS
jgi:hypothetical protein